MTEDQAAKLGELLKNARLKRGHALREVGAAIDVNYSWLRELEAGHYTEPAPDRLARLAEFLGIDPMRIDRVSKNHLADSLPEVRTYFRSKEKLNAEQLDEVEATLARLRAKYDRQKNQAKTKGGKK